MKKVNLCAILIALLPFCALAQPQATSANVSLNFTGEFYFAQANGFSPGAAGANQTWNFSGLDLVFGGTDTSIPVPGSPFASLFPTANYLYRYDGMGGTRYYYHKLSTDKYEILSLAYNTTVGDNYSPNPLTWVVFPYTYGTVFTDSYQSTDDEIATSFTATYDAYGTLILPTGTFNNVIRQKIVKNGQTDYIWFNVSPFYPLLQTVLAENALGIVKDTTVLGTDDHAQAQPAIWPNPTNGQVFIECGTFSDAAATVNVYDAFGKRVLQQQVANAGTTSFSIDLQHHNAGLYFLTLLDGDGRQLSVRKIVKQ